MHDITDLESRGVPAVFIASSEFVAASEAQAQALGLDAARVFVPHPIQDRTDDEMRALAEGVVDEVLAAVTAEQGSKETLDPSGSRSYPGLLGAPKKGGDAAVP